MKWTRINEWTEDTRRKLSRTFDNADGFNAARFLEQNVAARRFDLFHVIDDTAGVDLLVCSHTWEKSCYVLSIQGKGFVPFFAAFLAVMKHNGIDLVIFDTEQKGLLRMLCNRVDLQHLDGERYAFEVNQNED